MRVAASSGAAKTRRPATDGVMTASSVRTRRPGARRPLVLEDASDETLLATRLCDLPLQLEGTLMARRVKRLHRELQAHNIVALPHAWLSEEFFNPDGVLGFAIPFYLAHPRLMRLERSQMLEVEGAGEAECRRIFRHEAGHAIDEAYGLHNRERYRLLFGDPSRSPIPPSYKPRPESRDYVINLANWYAQAHPVEDFAETFAIWLNPHVDWRSDYKRWPALEKLEYVDELMREIAGKTPAHRRQERSRAAERAAAHAWRALRREAKVLCLELAGQLRPGPAPHLLGRPEGCRGAAGHALPASRACAAAHAHCGWHRRARLCRGPAAEADDRPRTEARAARHRAARRRPSRSCW